MAMWIMADLENRVREAWECGVIRYNSLLKDLDHAPESFTRIVTRFNRNATSAHGRDAGVL
jgi:hypothetical protein